MVLGIGVMCCFWNFFVDILEVGIFKYYRVGYNCRVFYVNIEYIGKFNLVFILLFVEMKRLNDWG